MPGGERRPDARQVDFDDVETWVGLSQTLEQMRAVRRSFHDIFATIDG